MVIVLPSYSWDEWLVSAGSEEEFIERCNTFIEWSWNEELGATFFVLVRSTQEPRKFLCLGTWMSQEAQEAWRQMPRTQELLGRCRELCEEFESHLCTLVPSSMR